LNSKAIFGFSTLNWRGINCCYYGYILCVDSLLRLLFDRYPTLKTSLFQYHCSSIF